jgi:hypothetical protein
MSSIQHFTEEAKRLVSHIATSFQETDETITAALEDLAGHIGSSHAALPDARKAMADKIASELARNQKLKDDHAATGAAPLPPINAEISVKV